MNHLSRRTLLGAAMGTAAAASNPKVAGLDGAVASYVTYLEGLTG